MKTIDEITVASNVDYSSQPSTVKSSLGFVPFFVLEREETENQIYSMLPHVSSLAETLQNTSSLEWKIPLTLFVLGSCTLNFLQERFYALHLPTTTFWCSGKVPLTYGSVCFLRSVEMF